jgi:endonuclease/exonuclease/phosphatase (EEP) superfamily protein YafD
MLNPKNGRTHLKWLLDRVFILATVILFLLSVAGYFGLFNRYLELTSHFKLQYLVASFCPFFYFLLRRQPLALSLSLFCLLINFYEIAPWYLPQSFSPANEIQGQPVKVLQSNVDKYGNNYPQVLSLVRKEKPDIAVFLEVGKKGAKELEVLRDILPYSIAYQDVDIDGRAIYSKFPLRNTSVKSLGGGRKSLLADITIQGKIVSLIAVHPSNAVGKAYVEERNRQLEAIGDYVANLKNPLLIGDFNITMWSPYYNRFVSKANVHNSRRGFGLLPTWPTFRPLLYIPIDHCFVHRDMKVLNTRTAHPVGSDHLPLITDLLISKKSVGIGDSQLPTPNSQLLTPDS